MSAVTCPNEFTRNKRIHTYIWINSPFHLHVWFTNLQSIMLIFDNSSPIVYRLPLKWPLFKRLFASRKHVDGLSCYSLFYCFITADIAFWCIFTRLLQQSAETRIVYVVASRVTVWSKIGRRCPWTDRLVAVVLKFHPRFSPYNTSKFRLDKSTFNKYSPSLVVGMSLFMIVLYVGMAYLKEKGKRWEWNCNFWRTVQ